MFAFCFLASSELNTCRTDLIRVGSFRTSLEFLLIPEVMYELDKVSKLLLERKTII